MTTGTQFSSTNQPPGAKRKNVFSAENQPANRGRKKNTEREAVMEVFKTHYQMDSDAVTHYLVKIAMGYGARGDEDPLQPVVWKHLMALLYPVPKQQSPLVEVPIPEGATPAQKADAVIDACARGEISVEAMQAFCSAVKQALEIHEVTELVDRMERLEALIAERQK